MVEENEIQDTVLSLVERARFHERGKPDFMNISIEALKTPVQHLTSLPVTLLDAGDAAAGRDTAKRLLRHLGVPLLCIDKAFSLLENGESMRGAIIMDLEGERLEPDKNRGVRATRMDITAEASNELRRLLATAGLSVYYTHISEALVLATKVASVKGTIAEQIGRAHV
jgi:6-carboxyhexanoate--CoA ligase